MNQLLIPTAKQATYGADDFKKFVIKRVATEECFGEKAGEVAKLISDFYLNTPDVEKKEHVFYLRRYTQVCISSLEGNKNRRSLGCKT